MDIYIVMPVLAPTATGVAGDQRLQGQVGRCWQRPTLLYIYIYMYIYIYILYYMYIYN